VSYSRRIASMAGKPARIEVMICQICSSASASWYLVLPACCHFVTTDAPVHALSIPFLAKMKLSTLRRPKESHNVAG
jgi:hypothetical protein